MQIIAVNGPPRAGKDTVADIIVNQSNGLALSTKFAAPLKCAAHSLFTALRSALPAASSYDDAFYEDSKDVPNADFFGLTPREAYINLSELMLKPSFNKFFFGEVMLRQIDRALVVAPSIERIVISDSGFADELRPLIERYGAESITVVRVHRMGHGFEGDSRSYLNPSDFGGRVRFQDIGNNRSLEDLETHVSHMLHRMDEEAMYGL